MAIAAYTNAKFNVDESTIEGGDGDSDESFLVIPGIFYSRPLNERLHLGLSFNVPPGMGYDHGDSWSMTGDLIWVDMSEFGVTHVSVEEDSISLEGQFRDMIVTSAGFKYSYGEPCDLRGRLVCQFTRKKQ